ncbi:uncharacterized protein LOC128171511 isoform X2 [Crassostrea angulata]|uniref:uncharacterized protein LOC128171511 isoform X2 n=1 Tax=Magallana angulata TaxID=2784310 RepID=UPI0022B1EED7|nr:uncharacterized protein LOC128171511 isoform X2 [Crassostrea angulata]
MEAPGLPSFTIQANSTFVLSGDTLAIKCLIYNISILTLVNSYSINWFKDDVQITKSFSDVINDAKYRVQLNIAKQEQNVMSELQIKNITIEDVGSFTCELKGGNIIKQRQSIFILIDDSNGTIYVNLTGYDVPNVTNLGISTSQTPFYKTHNKFDADDVTPVEMMETNVTNTTVAMENITDYDITDITDIPSVEMISSSMPEEITNYGQTTIINIKNTRIGVTAFIIVVIGPCILLTIRAVKRHRKRRLHISGPNDERPRDSVSLDSYDDVDTNEYMNHSMENIKNTRENTDIDCSIEENYQEFIAYYQEFEFGISTGATGGNDNRHTENQTAGSPYNRIVRKSFKNREKFLSMNPFSKDYDSISAKSAKTDDTEARNDRRKHNYEKCHIKVLEEYK